MAPEICQLPKEAVQVQSEKGYKKEYKTYSSAEMWEFLAETRINPC
jgi:hypothetical protein